jgi:hypothetical protein
VILGKACDLIDQHQLLSKQHRPFPMSHDEDVSDRADVDLNTSVASSVASNLNDATYVESTPLPSSGESERSAVRQRNQGVARDIFGLESDEDSAKSALERRISQTDNSSNSSAGAICETQRNSRDEPTVNSTVQSKPDSTIKPEAKVVLNEYIQVIGIPEAADEDDIPLTPLDGFMPIEIRMGLFANSSVKLSSVKMAPELGVHDDDDSAEEAGSNVEELGSAVSVASFTIGPPTRRTTDKVRRTISCSVDQCCGDLKPVESLTSREPFQLDPEDDIDPEVEGMSTASRAQTESSSKTKPASTQPQPQSSSNSSVCSSPFRMRSLSSPDLVQGASGGSDNDWPTIDDDSDGGEDSLLVQQQTALAASTTIRAASARNNSAPTPSTSQLEATIVPLSRSNTDMLVKGRTIASSESEVTGD